MFQDRPARFLPLIMLFLLLPGMLDAQQLTLKRTIEWTPYQTMQLENQEIKVFHFRNASYELNTLFPNYYEVLKIENNSEFDVRIQNAVYKEADNELLKDISGLEDLPAEPVVSSSVATLRKERKLQVSFIPLRKNPATGRTEMLESFDLRLTPTGHRLKSGSHLMADYADNSVLASGNWIKIKVTRDGIYRMSYEQLRNLGINNPENVRVYGNGGGMLPKMNNEERHDDLVENHISYRSDHILFYGQAPHVWKYDTTNDFFFRELHDYSDGTYYFLTSNLGRGNEVQDASLPGASATYFTNSYDALSHHETDEINLIQSGREWYGEHFDIITERDFAFNIPDLRISDPIHARIETAGRSGSNTTMQVHSAGNLIGTLEMYRVAIGDYARAYASVDNEFFSFNGQSEDLTLTLRYLKSSASSEAWLNYICLNARSNLNYAGSPLIFRDKNSVAPDAVTEYTVQGAGSAEEVWDITDPVRPGAMQTSNPGNALIFKASSNELREYIVFNPNTGYLSPITEGDDVGPVGKQNLHALKNINYVVICHPDFISHARQLAAHRHDQDNLDTLVLTPDLIYNEFSSGSPDVSAIRDFLRMLYNRAGNEEEMPRYVLLFGDGSYDNKGKQAANTNFILTYQSQNSIHPTLSFVTDDFFGLLDEDEGEAEGLVDIGIGRFPVQSADEAQVVLDKTLSYDQADKMGDWRNTICFIGDDEENNVHMRQADQLATYVESNYPNFSTDKIYLDAYTQVSTPSGPRYPDVNEAISQRIARGTLIMNYTGHGGSKGLAHERVIRIDDVLSWENSNKLPLFMTATCEFSRFDELEATSAGELVLLNPVGGGIALLTTTRLVYSGPNLTLNEQFYFYVFEKDEKGRNRKLGDIIRLTKNNTGTGINKRNFTLLGDPAIELAYPEHRIRVESINGKNINEAIDTLRALSTVTVSGYMEDQSGNELENYNGTIYPTIYDKSSSITTLNNDDEPFGPLTFSLRNRVLYKGKASISNGRYDFSFVVPKDISYNIDYGKLSFYAEDGKEDASGYFLDAVIGGSADSVASDLEGPELKVFMNDENFAYGGITDPNPVLLAFVSDSNGINTLGNGIGHDLTAVLDGNTSRTIVLNDYYESDKDSYKSGRIQYGFKDLEAGKHSIKVKVWDVYNNSSEQTIEFVVTTENDLILDKVLNYPNPFTTYTQFYFEHNQPSSDIDVLIQVFTISGKLVKTIEHYAPASGYRVGPIEWDGRDDYGGRIARGVYIYRVKVRTSMGHYAEKYEKLVILN